LEEVGDVAELGRDLLRKLAEWTSNGVPVSSVYLDVDGRRYPRKHDYMVRAEENARQLRILADPLGREARTSVEKDVSRMLEYFDGLERGPIRGVALFACSNQGLWEEVETPRPVKDRATLADHPYVLPLEALAETYQSFCTVIVDREKARFFLARMGRIREENELLDDVPGRHDQGGWSQARYQRHIDEHVLAHLKRVADVLLDYLKRAAFDHLILAGPHEVVVEFERRLHDYLKRRIAARTHLAMTVSAAEVLERSLAVEESVEERREREAIDRVLAEAAAGRNAVTGLGPVLDALNDARVDTLVVPFGFEAKGVRCEECGRLAESGSRCRTCGGPTEAVTDVVDSAVGVALRQSSRVDMVTFAGRDSFDGVKIGALLRF
jgi:peptide chain release factor subunit 1